MQLWQQGNRQEIMQINKEGTAQENMHKNSNERDKRLGKK